MKKEIGGLLALAGICFGALAGGAGNVSALTYSDESNVQFSFSSTLSISISDADIVIGNLIPGQDDLSNAVDVVVNTNNLYGYTLTATVGDATKDYRDLRHTNGTTNIASIDVNSDLSTLSGQSSSVWGYTISTDGTTWSNYNGLPKYDDTTNAAELRATDGAAADSTTSFKIGAYAEEGQLAGDYTNVINFKVVSNGAPHDPTLQEITTATCPNNATSVIDARDGKEYKIRLITTEYSTHCWMIDNLDLAGGTPLYSDTSNVPDGYPSSGGVPFYTLPSSSYDGYDDNDVAQLYNSNSTICDEDHYCYSYYNFEAATAGTGHAVTSDNTTYDICPKGWRLPIDQEYQDLISYNYYGEPIDYFTDAIVAPGPWNGIFGGIPGWGFSGSEGFYWSSTVHGEPGAYHFYHSEDNAGVDYTPRYQGLSVRCVLK